MKHIKLGFSLKACVHPTCGLIGAEAEAKLFWNMVMLHI